MNRIQEYYETAVEYLSLPVSARFLIALHFRLVKDQQLVYADQDEMDRIVFRGVAEKDMLRVFKKFVTHFKKSRGHEYLN